MLPLAVLTVLALVACGALAVLLVRARRERDDLLAARVPREALEDAERTVALLLDVVPVPVLLLDPDDAVARANVAARAAWPDLRDDAPCDVLPGLREAVVDARRGVEVAARELRTGDPGARTFQVHVRGAGGRGCVVAAAVDVTASVDFREARRLFSAAVSHELRTPLARLLGLAETLALPLSEEEREALVAQTEVEIDGMRRLLDEMLLLAALDRGEAAISEGSGDAGRAAQEVVADRLGRPGGRGRELTVEAPAGLEVPIAPRLLAVVIGNLLDNALRHGGPEAAVHIAVRPVNGHVEIEVADTGVGIPAEHLPHVFERFYRGEASRAGPGTGLGLAVVKHIVEAHGGRASVASTPGRGTTVRLVLPHPEAAPSSPAPQSATGVGSNR